jgi:hypothetical protein
MAFALSVPKDRVRVIPANVPPNAGSRAVLVLCE